MISCLTNLIRHLQTNPNLQRDGTSEHLDALTPSLFYFFAKYFAFFDASFTASKSRLQLSDVVIVVLSDCLACQVLVHIHHSLEARERDFLVSAVHLSPLHVLSWTSYLVGAFYRLEFAFEDMHA